MSTRWKYLIHKKDRWPTRLYKRIARRIDRRRYFRGRK